MDEWQFDNELNVWYLHLSIVIECETPYFPQKSQWFFVVGSEYPKGKIKVYPDVENSITVTLYHQANNSKIERNGLWRKGALCLEVSTIPNYQSEPYSVDERLLYHAKRAICWLELAAKGKLVTESEPFELPEFSMSNILEMQFAFSEDVVTFMQWESVECRYGIAELDVYKSKPFVYYVKVFKSLSNNIQHYTEWGKYLSKTTISPPIIAPWILMNQIPVVNEWQAPETFGELLVACEKQHINIMCVLQNIVSKIRDGKRHLLLIGFPVPRIFGGDPEIISWKGMVSLDGILYNEGNYEKIQKKIGYLPQEIDLYPNLTVKECLVYMGGLSGVARNDLEQRITYYLEKTSLTEHQNKKMRQLSGGMKRRVGLIQALLNNPDFLIIDEPTTGLDPEERIRIRNLLVDFSKDRTVLFSTHVVEDLAATCTQLSIMKKGSFLYSGSVSGLLENAKGCVWSCTVQNAEEASLLENNYSISSKQYVENGIHMKVLSKEKPNENCVPDNDITLEDAYIYLTNS